MAENIEKIFNETTNDIFKKLSFVEFDAGRKASKKIDEEFIISYSKPDESDNTVEETQVQAGSI